MEIIHTKIDGKGGLLYRFEIYPNTEPINIGDYFLFNFGGSWHIDKCSSEREMSEINQHDRPYKTHMIDLVHSFWRGCYKIYDTNFPLKTLDNE